MTNSKGTLYLCATPIGNLEDMTFRAVRILKEVDVIAAEDTRNSVKLLNHFDIHTPMTSYHEFNKIDKGQYLVKRLLEGENIALITDAGMPRDLRSGGRTGPYVPGCGSACDGSAGSLCLRDSAGHFRTAYQTVLL